MDKKLHSRGFCTALVPVARIGAASTTLTTQSGSVIGLVILTVFSFFGQRVRADLIDDFRREYPPAAALVEQAYSHVKMTEEESNYGAPGELQSVQKVEYYRDGDLVRVATTASESIDPDLPTGSTFAFGGSPEKFYKIRKANDSKPFVLEAFGAKDNFDFFVRTHSRALFAPYCIYEARIVDFLFKQRNPPVSVVAAVPSTLDGEPAVRVTAEFTVPGNVPNAGLKRYYIYFQPKTWALLGWTFEYKADQPEGGRSQCRLAYRANTNPPELSSLQYWGDKPSAPMTKYNYSKIDITSLEFGSVDKSEFSLASFGVTEPYTPGKRSRLFWALAINVPILIVLGIVFTVLAHRRRRAA
jgi:hypothetical protein